MNLNTLAGLFFLFGALFMYSFFVSTEEDRTYFVALTPGKGMFSLELEFASDAARSKLGRASRPRAAHHVVELSERFKLTEKEIAEVKSTLEGVLRDVNPSQRSVRRLILRNIGNTIVLEILAPQVKFFMTRAENKLRPSYPEFTMIRNKYSMKLASVARQEDLSIAEEIFRGTTAVHDEIWEIVLYEVLNENSTIRSESWKKVASWKLKSS